MLVKSATGLLIYLINITHSFLSLFVFFVLFCFCFERERERERASERREGGRERVREREREREFHANEQVIHLGKSISLLTLFEIFCLCPHLFQCNRPIPTTTFITIMIVTTIHQIFFIFAFSYLYLPHTVVL